MPKFLSANRNLLANLNRDSQPPANWTATVAGDGSCDLWAIDCEAASCEVAPSTYENLIGSVTVVHRDPKNEERFVDVMVRPSAPIHLCHYTSGLNQRALELTRLTREPLFQLLAEVVPPSAVIAFHNAPADLKMMGLSLWRGQIVDTATDDDMRAIARQEIAQQPSIVDDCPWKTPGSSYSWAQYQPGANGDMSLAGLVYLFTKLVIHKEGNRSAHSSYIDAVATMGLAKLVIVYRGGYDESDHSRIGSGRNLWEYLPPQEKSNRMATLALIDAERRELRDADRVMAEKIWEKLAEYQAKLAATAASRRGSLDSDSVSGPFV